MAHDPRVVGDVRRGRHLLDKLAQIRRAADVLQLATRPQRVGQRHQIHRLAAQVEILHGAQDLAVRLAIKIVGDDELDGAVERGVVEQNPAQDRFLGLHAVRRDLADVGVEVGHRGGQSITKPFGHRQSRLASARGIGAGLSIRCGCVA